MNLINLTEHPIMLMTKDKLVIKKFEGAGKDNAARVTCKDTVSDTIKINDKVVVDVVKKQFGSVYNLPEPKNGIGYIVSRIVAEACRDRTDLYMTANPVRNSDRQIIGCTAFSQLL